MQPETFPNTRQDVADLKNTAADAAKDLRDTASTHLDKAKEHAGNLKTTAVDAAKDLKSTAAVHAEKAKGQLNNLAEHARAEGSDKLNEVKGKFQDVADAARSYISERPIASVGIALAAGFLVGLSRRRS